MQEIISLLTAVLSTMDTIPIIGVENQDRFVGCANALKSILGKLNEMEE